MNLTSLEREIVAEARGVLNNPKLGFTEILAWSTGKGGAKPQNEAEIAVFLPVLKVWACIPAALDKRKPCHAPKGG